MTPDQLEIDATFMTLGPVSATAAPDGSFVVVDFQLLDKPTSALRVGFPIERLQSLIGGLSQILKALEEPASGIHLQHPH